jgi:capsular exopolysaccharide synthesis family protein
MSRIHDVLNKAERDGTARRVRGGAALEALDLPPAEPIGPEPVALTSTVLREVPPASAHDKDTSVPFTTEPAGIREITGVQLSPLLIAATDPQSLAAEEYRTLRTRIAQSATGRAVRTIAITSAGKGDGKSVSAANLALTIAQEFQRRVVLVDADLRHPRVHQLLGLSDGVGLADVLAGSADLETALVSLPEHNLTILPAGLPPLHPAELLSSAPMRRVMDTLRQRYDRVVIDLPPAAPIADVQILTPLVDGFLFIVRAGLTAKPAIERALNTFDRSKLLGMVLNEANGDSDAAYQPYTAHGA